ncbi:MAG: ribbon-helix-helix protein, CopG family [Cyanobacteria bacterium M_surface_7_m2_040]|nr:ribbon-helix-helix protein, CopG family [Cyanobacteria bacterium K_Offshore_0m_m2_072]MBM5826506.1 ribbon-helix-helix protein, CopG family [Cyanobacteria bacterium M_surface_7_m2_040]
MAVVSLKLPDALDAELSEQAQRRRLSKSELMRRALRAFLQGLPEPSPAAEPTAADLVADLVGCCEGAPPDLSSNPVHLAGFGER